MKCPDCGSTRLYVSYFSPHYACLDCQAPTVCLPPELEAVWRLGGSHAVCDRMDEANGLQTHDKESATTATIGRGASWSTTPY